MGAIFPALVVVIIVGLVIIAKWINILNEYERGVSFWLGRVQPHPKGPGFVFVFWPFERIIRISLRTIVHDIPSQEIITRDNVSLRVNAVVYFQVMNPNDAVIKVENYLYATSQLAQTTLRSILGQAELDTVLSEREKLNLALQDVLDKHTNPWGIKVSMVEVKQVDLPEIMQRAMARQAEAEREKRAKIIHAEGEHEASVRLAEAAKIMQGEPISLQLRYLQTLTEIATEKNSTIIFPIPIDTIQDLMQRLAGKPPAA